MKIKLAVLDKDKNYLNKIVSVFNTKYSDEVEIYSFTDMNIIMSKLGQDKIDILIADELFDIDVDSLPKRCGFAYFVDSPDIETVKECRAICKFQKIDLIYKQILSIYSEKTSNIIGMKTGAGSSKLIAFISFSGGVGSSTMAAASAINLSKRGKKVFYLNIEPFGGSDCFFHDEGHSNMSDIIYALEEGKLNQAKIESCVRQDQNGVCFFAQANSALDMLELTTEKILDLISQISSLKYDMVVVDMSFQFDESCMKILKKMHEIVVVGDGSEISNVKTFRGMEALKIYDEQERKKGSEICILDKISIIYNKFSDKTCKVLDNMEHKTIDGVQRYEHATTEQIIEQLSSKNKLFRWCRRDD